MNQDFNILNNNTNQENSSISNQPLNNNQNINNTYSQSQSNVNMTNQINNHQYSNVQQQNYPNQNFNHQSMNQNNSYQQQVQPNYNNQNVNINPKKKSKIGIIIFFAIFVALIIILLLIFNKNNKPNQNVSYDEQYLDASRDLKSEYDYKEIFDSFAVMLNKEKSYIIKPNDNYIINSMQLFQGFFQGMIGHYKDNNGNLIAYYRIMILNNSNLQEVKQEISSNSSYKIIDETSEYILSVVGEDYVYHCIFENTIFEVQFGIYDDQKKIYSTNEKVITIIQNLKSIIHEDDNKEPYLVDKVINVKLNNNYKIKSYLLIGLMNNDVMNDVSYNIDLSYSDADNNFYSLDINYYPERTINNYDKRDKINENPNIYYATNSIQNDNIFIINQNGKDQTFKISKSNIDGNDIQIKTYKDFSNNIKVFLD